jgi:hypothetical protein
LPASATSVSRSRSRQARTWLAEPEVRASVATCVIVGLLTAGIAAEALVQHLQADFPEHLGMTAAAIRTGVFPGDAGFYFMNALLAGFSTSTKALKGSLVVLLGLATAGKTWASIAVVRREGGQPLWRGDRLPVWALVAIALCAFAFSFAGQNTYLGQIPANVFHNSTEVFLMPFAVVLFGLTLGYLHRPDPRLLQWGVLLVVLNVLIKPSLLFCVAPVFPLAVLLRYGWSREFQRAVMLAAVALLVVLGQYLYIYVVRPGGTTTANDGTIALGPLVVWHDYTTSIPKALLLSYVLPIVAVAVGGRRILRSTAVLYAGALTVLGLAEFAVLKETGTREFDGNFLWQAIVCTYLLFLAIVSATVNWVRERGWNWRSASIAIAFLAHVVAGVAYLYTWFHTGAFA